MQELVKLAEQLQSAPEWEPGAVEVVQTHISVVLLGAKHVLKLKKPVNFGFLDYSTLEKRRAACEAEVVFNRRHCPETYLGVREIRVKDGVARIGGDGRLAEYGVWMRRLPANRMLDAMVRAGQVGEDVVEAIAVRLAEFHAGARRGPEVDRWGTREWAARNWEENFEQTRRYRGRTISGDDFDRIEAWVRSELRGRSEAFDARVDAGRIVDGHGDLRCESVCVEDGILLYDCIEFSERLRCCDVASEAAFLAMDLHRRGRPDLSYYFTQCYAERSGDGGLFALLPFYRCYRAYVRGKVLSFRLDDTECGAAEKQEAERRAQEFFDLAARYAARLAEPTLVVVRGLSGSGKTAIARGLAAELGYRVVSSDAVRAELYGAAKGPAAYGEGVYSEEAGTRTYAALLGKARELLREDGGAIMDATFRTEAQMAGAAAMAEAEHARLRWIHCTVQEEIARQRIETRQARKESLSDADWTTRQTQRKDQAAVAASGDRALTLDTEPPIAECTAFAAKWLRES